jgi:G patch domain-containing protein 1
MTGNWRTPMRSKMLDLQACERVWATGQSQCWYTSLLANGSRKPDVLESLIAPARSSIGQSLLQKQGWRPGQGIGPRVTARKLKWQEAKMGLGVAGPSRVMDEDEDMDGGEAGKHTFAPRDTKLVVYQAKDDREGLGFQKGMGMGRLPQSRKAGPCG